MAVLAHPDDESLGVGTLARYASEGLEVFLLTRTQMTYDLRRLRLKGVIARIPKTHRYTATTYGLKVAFFYSKLYLRILRLQWNALLPDTDHLPRPLRAALDQLDAEIRKLHDEATLPA